jgi:Lar family restriction alleviation protein
MTEPEMPELPDLLKPCPFCGTSDLRTVWTDFGVDDTPMHVSIACNECLAELPPCITEAGAVTAWNTRANPTRHGKDRG